MSQSTENAILNLLINEWLFWWANKTIAKGEQWFLIREYFVIRQKIMVWGWGGGAKFSRHLEMLVTNL